MIFNRSIDMQIDLYKLYFECIIHVEIQLLLIAELEQRIFPEAGALSKEFNQFLSSLVSH